MVDGLSAQAFIGYDFLKAQKVTVNFGTDQLIFPYNGQNILVNVGKPGTANKIQKSTLSMVRAASRDTPITLAPGETTFIPMKIDSSWPDGTNIGVVFPEPHIGNHYIHAPKCIQITEGGHFLAFVQNVGDETSEVPQIDAIVAREHQSAFMDDSPLDLDESKVAESKLKRQRIAEVQANLEESAIYPKHKQTVLDLIKKFEDLWAPNPKKPRQTHWTTLSIETTGKPVRQKPYQMPFAKEKIVQETIQALEDNGLITKSQGPWGSPVLVVPKKDGTFKIAIDYRKLNNQR